MMPSTAPPESGGDSSKKVAIIVVHGVSDQQPYDSARSIANLLLHTNKEQPPLDTNEKQSLIHANEEEARYEEPRYSAWNEQLIGIPVRPIPVRKRTKLGESDISPMTWLLRWLWGWLDERGEPVQSDISPRTMLLRWLWGWLDERGERIRDYLDSKPSSTANLSFEEKSHAFTCDFLDSYSPKKDLKASFYETICIKACRDDRHEVHLYEMYWADLSRVGRGFFQVFSEFYQILFHLSALGRHTLDMAALEHPDKFRWRCYASLHGWAGRILSIPIPLLNLFLVVAALLNLVGNIPGSYSSSVASVILSLLGIFLLGFVFWKNVMKLPLPWLFLPGIVALAIIRSSWCQEFSYKLLALEWLVVLSLLTALVIKKYSDYRPGADRVAIFLALLLVVLALWNSVFKVENSPVGILKVSFKLIELIYFLLVVSWILFFCLYFVVVIWGWFAQCGLTNAQAKERAKRASWTASVSLWIPSVSFSSVTLTLWAVLAQVGASLLPKNHLYCPASLLPKDYGPYCLASSDYPYRPTDWFRNWLSLKDPYYTPSDFINELIVDPVLGIAIFSIVIVLPLMAWSFLPSVWAEVQPPESTHKTDKPKAEVQQPDLTSQPDKPNSDEKLSLKFGIWLNNGYRTVHCFLSAISAVFIIVVIAYWTIIVFFPNLWIVEFIKKYVLFKEPVTQFFAVLITASATSIFVIGSRLEQLSLGIRNVIDVILDVDNYLRLHPEKDNPRARIFSRYYSLLRYLCKETDSQNQPKYDALILVAHSQGAVITADLLRFIKNEERKSLKRLFSSSHQEEIPVYFFSMGNPLRQLYSVGFPHLYEWVINYNEPDENGPNNYDQNGLGDKPKPEDLGLEQWVNTYNSGDYVGRYLWRKSKSEVNEKKRTREEKLFKPSSSVEDKDNISEKGKYREFCLGAGAHTHYWNATTNRVADEINRLIDKATRS
ncbi:hypothetical protein [Microcoleus sp. D2_18a_B4]|uniref:hypothetical protein n=1 Tax=Microcoleus sp. D2_18a_B4 TaxID=3055329 RepID=UPI002FCFD0B2